MARNKSIIKNVSISIAKRTHRCKRSRNHIIRAGERRLAIKEGRSVKHYCLACATATLEAGIRDIQNIQVNLGKNDTV